MDMLKCPREGASSESGAPFLLLRIKQDAARYAMHRDSALRAGNNPHLDNLASGAWLTLQRTINEATNPDGSRYHGSETQSPA